MTTFLGAKVNDVCDIIFDPEPGPARKAFFEAVYETPEGAAFRKLITDSSIARVIEIVNRWYPEHPGREITVPMFVAVVKSLLDTKDPAVVPPEVVEPEEPDVPRDRNGTILSPSQLAWIEHGEYAQANSVNNCRARAQADPSFKNFMASSYHQEMNSQPVDAGLILSERQPDVPKTVKVTPALIQFAERYQKTQVSEIRRQMSAANLNHREFAKNVDDAMAAGLI